MLNSGSQLPRRIERDLKWAYKALIENDRTKGKGNDIELYHQLLRAELPVGEIVTKITSTKITRARCNFDLCPIQN
jgi:hypothetical protein